MYGSLDHDLHGQVVVLLHLEIGHPAISLCRGDAAVTEKILNDREIRTGIEQLGGHSVPQFMARNS